MNRMGIIVLQAVVVIILTGCEGGVNSPTDLPFVRVANADATGENVDFCIDGRVALMQVESGEISGYSGTSVDVTEVLRIEAGSTCEDGTPLDIAGSIELTAGTRNTIVIPPDGSAAFQLVDDLSPTSAGTARIRVINAIPDSESITVLDEADQVIIEGVRYNEPGDFVYIETDTDIEELTIRPLADESAERTLINFNLEEGSTYTIFVTGSVNGDDPISAPLYRDASVGITD